MIFRVILTACGAIMFCMLIHTFRRYFYNLLRQESTHKYKYTAFTKEEWKKLLSSLRTLHWTLFVHVMMSLVATVLTTSSVVIAIGFITTFNAFFSLKEVFVATYIVMLITTELGSFYLYRCFRRR